MRFAPTHTHTHMHERHKIWIYAPRKYFVVGFFFHSICIWLRACTTYGCCCCYSRVCALIYTQLFNSLFEHRLFLLYAPFIFSLLLSNDYCFFIRLHLPLSRSLTTSHHVTYSNDTHTHTRAVHLIQ